MNYIHEKWYLKAGPVISMNQQCKVCGEPAAGFHFGAFTCEGCKSFFGRTYNNLSSISECKNNGECVINKKNRTACKACRLRKCLYVGMSKSGSRYGRRSNWFKIHCLLQEQQQQHQHQPPTSPLTQPVQSTNHLLAGQLSYFLPNQHQHRQIHQNNNKCQSPVKPAVTSNPFLMANHFLPGSRELLNGNNDLCSDKNNSGSQRTNRSTPSDSGASSADPEDSIASNKNIYSSPLVYPAAFSSNSSSMKLEPIRSMSEPLSSYLVLPHMTISPALQLSPSASSMKLSVSTEDAQDEPIDLSVKSQRRSQTASPKLSVIENVPKVTPLDLTLVKSDPLSG